MPGDTKASLQLYNFERLEGLKEMRILKYPSAGSRAHITSSERWTRIEPVRFALNSEAQDSDHLKTLFRNTIDVILKGLAGVRLKVVFLVVDVDGFVVGLPACQRQSVVRRSLGVRIPRTISRCQAIIRKIYLLIGRNDRNLKFRC